MCFINENDFEFTELSEFNSQISYFNISTGQNTGHQLVEEDFNNLPLPQLFPDLLTDNVL